MKHLAVGGLGDRAKIAVVETHGDLETFLPFEMILNLIPCDRARNTADHTREQ